MEENLKFCKDCKHFLEDIPTDGRPLPRIFRWCNNHLNVRYDLITGSSSLDKEPHELRKDDTKCGKDGKWFKPLEIGKCVEVNPDSLP